jgi:hypothetical protein
MFTIDREKVRHLLEQEASAEGSAATDVLVADLSVPKPSAALYSTATETDTDRSTVIERLRTLRRQLVDSGEPLAGIDQLQREAEV